MDMMQRQLRPFSYISTVWILWYN